MTTVLPGRLSSFPAEVGGLGPCSNRLMIITSVNLSDHLCNQTKSDRAWAIQVYCKPSSFVHDQAMVSRQRWRCLCREKNAKPHTWIWYIRANASSKYRYWYTGYLGLVYQCRTWRNGERRTVLVAIGFATIAFKLKQPTINKDGWYNINGMVAYQAGYRNLSGGSHHM